MADLFDMAEIHLIKSMLAQLDDDELADLRDLMHNHTAAPHTSELLDGMIESIPDYPGAAVAAIETASFLNLITITPVDKHILRKLRRPPVSDKLVWYATALAMLLEPYNVPDEDFDGSIPLDQEEYRSLYNLAAIGVYNRLVEAGCWGKYLESNADEIRASFLRSIWTSQPEDKDEPYLAPSISYLASCLKNNDLSITKKKMFRQALKADAEMLTNSRTGGYVQDVILAPENRDGLIEMLIKHYRMRCSNKYDETKYEEICDGWARLISRHADFIPAMADMLYVQLLRNYNDNLHAMAYIGSVTAKFIASHELASSLPALAPPSYLEYLLIAGETQAMTKKPEEAQDEPEKLLRELSASRQKINELDAAAGANKRTLSEQNKELYEARSLQKKAEEGLEETETKLLAEIERLNDVIWHLSQPRKDEDNEPEDSELLSTPYITDKRIVVFAGHTKWTNQMQKHFPSVTFVESGAAFDYRLIVNADMIFVQTAYIGHKMFYAITSAARKSKTKMYYLSSTGQRICKETMIAEIEKL